MADGCHVNPMRRVLVLAFAALAAAPFAATPSAARADEIAPELETLELRQKAEAETKRLVAGLSPPDQRRLTGVYVAFDSSPGDPSAMVACDDDGDYVIVLSDAMLRLVFTVARAQSDDEATRGHNVEDYAAFVARVQVPGRRLLPPPPGFFTGQVSGANHDTRLREALSFVVARELTHLRAGDLVCAHPTATHEAGDDQWTSSEQRGALEGAATIYPGLAAERPDRRTHECSGQPTAKRTASHRMGRRYSTSSATHCGANRSMVAHQSRSPSGWRHGRQHQHRCCSSE